jgi:subtilisin family serine protease
MVIRLNIIFLLLSSGLFAQNKAWVFFKDSCSHLSSQTSEYSKGPSGNTIAIHAEILKKKKIPVRNISKWLNAISIDQIFVGDVSLTNAGTCIDHVQPVKTLKRSSVLFEDDSRTSFAMEQVNGMKLVNAGLTGKNVKIGVIDGGFLKADQDEALKHLFPGRIAAYRDYLTPDLENFGGSLGQGDDHGTIVLKMIAGFDSTTNIRFGLAAGADFYLARTDHGLRESRIEEDNWVAALEWLDSCGVRIINSSVGYNYGFDDPGENYKPADMDGETAVVSKALQIALKEKDILVIVSAGNDGNKDWGILCAPGDVEGSLTVGASNFDSWSKARYSSVGPEFIDHIKPDVSCFAINGTSFSAPVITGMAACISEFDSTLTGQEIKKIITSSGHLFPHKNNYLGYGVPDGEVILSILHGESDKRKLPKIVSKKMRIVFDVSEYPFDHLVAMHVNSSGIVLKQEKIHPQNEKFNIRKVEGSEETVVFNKRQVTRIVWK